MHRQTRPGVRESNWSYWFDALEVEIPNAEETVQTVQGSETLLDRQPSSLGALELVVQLLAMTLCWGSWMAAEARPGLLMCSCRCNQTDSSIREIGNVKLSKVMQMLKRLCGEEEDVSVTSQLGNVL